MATIRLWREGGPGDVDQLVFTLNAPFALLQVQDREAGNFGLLLGYCFICRLLFILGKITF